MKPQMKEKKSLTVNAKVPPFINSPNFMNVSFAWGETHMLGE